MHKKYSPWKSWARMGIAKNLLLWMLSYCNQRSIIHKVHIILFKDNFWNLKFISWSLKSSPNSKTVFIYFLYCELYSSGSIFKSWDITHIFFMICYLCTKKSDINDFSAKWTTSYKSLAEFPQNIVRWA